MNLLNDLPVATITFLASIVLIVVAYLSNDMSVNEAFVALGLAGGGSGVIGHARNGAGRGMRH